MRLTAMLLTSYLVHLIIAHKIALSLATSAKFATYDYNVLGFIKKTNKLYWTIYWNNKK